MGSPSSSMSVTIGASVPVSLLLVIMPVSAISLLSRERVGVVGSGTGAELLTERSLARATIFFCCFLESRERSAESLAGVFPAALRSLRRSSLAFFSAAFLSLNCFRASRMAAELAFRTCFASSFGWVDLSSEAATTAPGNRLAAEDSLLVFARSIWPRSVFSVVAVAVAGVWVRFEVSATLFWLTDFSSVLLRDVRRSGSTGLRESEPN